MIKTANRTNNMMKKKHLMNKIREYDFAIVETALFLDAHPECKKALVYYSKVKDGYKNAVEEFEKSFGPLNIYSANNEKKWNWIDGPWPWEGEC